VEPLSQLDPRLSPLLCQPLTWYQALTKVLMAKYVDQCRMFIAPDGNVQHVVVLHPRYVEAFMMLSIDLHTSRGVSFFVLSCSDALCTWLLHPVWFPCCSLLLVLFSLYAVPYTSLCMKQQVCEQSASLMEHVPTGQWVRDHVGLTLVWLKNQEISLCYSVSSCHIPLCEWLACHNLFISCTSVVCCHSISKKQPL
jgi:hypothetical protein